MRKFLLALVLLLAVIFVFGRLAEVETIGQTISRGDWRFLMLALCPQALWFFNVAVTYRIIYLSIGLDEKVETLLLAAAGANFVNVIAPSAGVGGIAVFLSTAKRNGYSTARTTVASILYLLFDYFSFMCVLALGLVVLFRRNNLNMGELIATAILMAFAIILAILLYLGVRSGKALGKALAWMAHQGNALLRPILHHDRFSEDHSYQFAQEAAEGIREIRRKPRQLLLVVLTSLTNKALLISVLLLVFLAFQVPLSIGTLIASFSIGYLFLIVSPTPAGIGIAEGALALALSSMYIPIGAATVVALSFRGITFWVPLAFGGLALRLLERQ